MRKDKPSKHQAIHWGKGDLLHLLVSGKRSEVLESFHSIKEACGERDSHQGGVFGDGRGSGSGDEEERKEIRIHQV